MIYTHSRTTIGPASPSQIRVQGLSVDAAMAQPADPKQAEGRRNWGRFSVHTCKQCTVALNAGTLHGPRKNNQASLGLLLGHTAQIAVLRALGVTGVQEKKCIIISDLRRRSDALFCRKKREIYRVKAGCSHFTEPVQSITAMASLCCSLDLHH